MIWETPQLVHHKPKERNGSQKQLFMYAEHTNRNRSGMREGKVIGGDPSNGTLSKKQRPWKAQKAKWRCHYLKRRGVQHIYNYKDPQTQTQIYWGNKRTWTGPHLCWSTTSRRHRRWARLYVHTLHVESRLKVDLWIYKTIHESKNKRSSIESRLIERWICSYRTSVEPETKHKRESRWCTEPTTLKPDLPSRYRKWQKNARVQSEQSLKLCAEKLPSSKLRDRRSTVREFTKIWPKNPNWIGIRGSYPTLEIPLRVVEEETISMKRKEQRLQGPKERGTRNFHCESHMLVTLQETISGSEIPTMVVEQRSYCGSLKRRGCNWNTLWGAIILLSHSRGGRDQEHATEVATIRRTWVGVNEEFCMRNSCSAAGQETNTINGTPTPATEHWSCCGSL